MNDAQHALEAILDPHGQPALPCPCDSRSEREVGHLDERASHRRHAVRYTVC